MCLYTYISILVCLRVFSLKLPVVVQVSLSLCCVKANRQPYKRVWLSPSPNPTASTLRPPSPETSPCQTNHNHQPNTALRLLCSFSLAKRSVHQFWCNACSSCLQQARFSAKHVFAALLPSQHPCLVNIHGTLQKIVFLCHHLGLIQASPLSKTHELVDQGSMVTVATLNIHQQVALGSHSFRWQQKQAMHFLSQG